MSTALRTQLARRRSMFPAIASVVGLVLAAGWFFAVRQATKAERYAAESHALERVAGLIDVLRQTAQDCAKGDAQLLAEDPRLKSTLGLADVDEATILDVLQDLQKLNGQQLFAVLTPEGRVKVALGAPKLKGLDLSTSSIVKTALGQEGAAVGPWMVDDRVAEVAAAAVRVGDRTVAVILVGGAVPDATLAKAAQAAGVHLALMVDDRLVWSDGPMAAATWTQDVARIEVKGAVPPSRFMAAPIETEDPLWKLAFAVPALALVFAVLAFWRGGFR